jgi:hypothetical protein
MSDPDVSHPSGIIVFLILTLIAILFDRGKRVLLESASHYYQPVMHAFFEELSTFGFVSLIAFIVKKDWDGQKIVYLIGDSIGEGLG